MYEIVVRFRQREEVMETVDSLATAMARVQAYRRSGYAAFYRTKVRRAA